ncbi:hypothetical protein HY969_00570 [Candidatus Kaiserbacteria bacterium]|nr:hypothetical protein [Candidatus Kaiserbacteria bacterium]
MVEKQKDYWSNTLAKTFKDNFDLELKDHLKSFQEIIALFLNSCLLHKGIAKQAGEQKQMDFLGFVNPERISVLGDPQTKSNLESLLRRVQRGDSKTLLEFVGVLYIIHREAKEGRVIYGTISGEKPHTIVQEKRLPLSKEAKDFLDVLRSKNIQSPFEIVHEGRLNPVACAAYFLKWPDITFRMLQ